MARKNKKPDSPESESKLELLSETGPVVLLPAENSQDLFQEAVEGLAGPVNIDFVAIEKNLANIGFFSPQSKRTKKGGVKQVTSKRMVDGVVIEVSAKIIPSVVSRLPNTSDQDLFFAFQKLVQRIKTERGTVTNPVAFKSSELLDILGVEKSGRDYLKVADWLNVMRSTGIISESAIYVAGKKQFVTDRFGVFDRAISQGKEYDEGIADRNLVWLAEWLLANINDNYMLPVDFESYRKLRNIISKALVPLLQNWLYASRRERVFEKRYDDLCAHLGLAQQKAISRIRQQLQPSLDELVEMGYLESWELLPTTERKQYKLVLRHGRKFFEDRRKRLEGRENSDQTIIRKRRLAAKPKQQGLFEVEVVESLPKQDVAITNLGTSAGPEEVVVECQPSNSNIETDTFAEELQKRGVAKREAFKLAREITPGQAVYDQLDYIDHLVRASKGAIKNPPGFFVSLLRANIQIPESFEPSSKVQAREVSERELANEVAQLIEEYELQREKTLNEYISRVLEAESWQALLDQERAVFLANHPNAGSWAPKVLDETIEPRVRNRLAEEIGFPSQEAFLKAKGNVAVLTGYSNNKRKKIE